MDARITKQRLAVLLSYDWLKILGIIAAAVVALYVLFLMIATRPTIAQVYTVYTYGGLRVGDDSVSLTDRLDGIFSFDILEVKMQNFDQGMLGDQAMTARRSMFEGDAVFASDYAEAEGETSLMQLCNGYTNSENGGGFYDIPAFLDGTETYLRTWFRDDLTGEPDAEAVKNSFYRKNGSDKRFKTEAQKQAGIAGEHDRVLAVRDDYLFVKRAFDDGSLYTVECERTLRDGETVRLPIGIGLGNLTGLSDLFYYVKGDNTVSAENIVLLFFDNRDSAADAKYENWAFVRYLLETYAPVHS